MTQGSILGSGRSPGGGHGNPPVFFPGESHGQRRLEGCSPWGCKELDTTEANYHCLNCSTWDLPSLLQYVGSSVETCGI